MRLCVALTLGTQPAFAQHLVESARIFPNVPDTDFAGLSGLELTDDGQRGFTVSDKGHLFELLIKRSRSGEIIALSVLNERELINGDHDGRLDTEGLALTDNGLLYSSLEAKPRVKKIALETAVMRNISAPPDDRIKVKNLGFEAVAVSGQGDLFAAPELAPQSVENIPLYKFSRGVWSQVASLKKDRWFCVVGADFGPDGALYLLERAASPVGFRSQIRKLSWTGEAVVSTRLWRSSLGKYDNLEGLSVTQDHTGRLRFLMVSDNNFKTWQRTEFVELTTKERVAQNVAPN